MTIPNLIDKQDAYEIIRDQIAAILATESASQQALAVLAGEDPELWKLRVYKERSNPWESFLNDQSTDTSPIVNVVYDTSDFDLSKSNIQKTQQGTSMYNLDCYAIGVSKDNPAGGQILGDEQAAINVQRAVMLVRNILMAAEYTYLGLRGTVALRVPRSIEVFRPEIDAQQIQKVIGARISFRVDHIETSPQFDPETLEYLSVDVLRAEDGEILAEADFDYT